MNRTMMRLSIICTLAAGCYTTRIVNGTPPQRVAPMAQDRWHHSVVAGIAEISPPVDLEENCRDANWAEIKEELTFLNAIVSGGTGGIYTPRTYTVMCGTATAQGSALQP